MGADQIRFDHRKLEELILWIADKVSDVGLTKLEKLLYLCDFISAEKTGTPITGETYRKFAMGPVAKHLKPIFQGMKGRSLQTEEIPLRGKNKPFVKLNALRRCDASVFASQEKQIINEVIERFGAMPLPALLDYVHEEITHKATVQNQEIPYFLAPYRRYERPEKSLAEELRNDTDYVERLRAAL